VVFRPTPGILRASRTVLGCADTRAADAPRERPGTPRRSSGRIRRRRFMRPTRLDLIINPGGGQLSATEHLGDSSSDSRMGYPNIVVTRPRSSSLKTKAEPLISYRPRQPTGKLVSVSSTWKGRGSPASATRVASCSAGSRSRRRRSRSRTGAAGRLSRRGCPVRPPGAECSGLRPRHGHPSPRPTGGHVRREVAEGAAVLLYGAASSSICGSRNQDAPARMRPGNTPPPA
jgi:hypothetical protein